MLKQHLITAMRSLPECHPRGPGAGNKDIEEAAELGLGLPYQDGWLTWSLLHSLIDEEVVESVAIKRGKSKGQKYRLKSYP